LSEETPKAPREFQPIESRAEALGLLKEGAKTLASAMLWTRNQEHTLRTHINVFSEADQVIYVWKPKEFDVGKFIDDQGKSGTEDCFFSVSLNRANLFFKARFAGYDDGGLKFKIPEIVFKVQRRKDLRYLIPDTHTLRIEFRDPLFPEKLISKKLADISAGGLAFFVEPKEEPIFVAGTVLKDMTVSVTGKKIICDGEIRHVKQVSQDSKHYPAVRIGVLFQKIRPGDAQYIAQFVFEESRKFFAKFI